MITPKFIKNEIVKQRYEISLHADDERIADSLTISQIEFVLSNCKVLEQYPEDPRGESCLVVGFTFEETPVHVVCGKNTAGHLFLITVYIPTMPKWKDPYTRSN
jgi:hypothetical protein